MRKYKRRSVGALCAMMFFGMSLIFGGAVIVDEKLALAESRALQIFALDETDIGGEVKACYLQGLDGEEDYILVEREPAGYAIFYEKNFEIIEYSHNGRSPFDQMRKSDRVYGGPANYYKKDDNTLVQMITGETCPIEQAKQTAEQIKEIISPAKETFSGTDQISDSNIENSPGPTGEDPVDPNKYKIVNRKFISDYQYFISDPYHAQNIDGTCVTIAVQLLLGYHNWSKDGRLITNPEHLAGRTGDNPNLNIPYHIDTISTTDEFYKILLGYIDPERDGASLNDAVRGIRSYLSEHSDISCRSETSVVYPKNESAMTGIKEQINQDRPSIVTINTYEPLEEGYEIIGHAVVAYGYQTFRINGQDIEGLIVHYGWQSNSRCVWVNGSWVKRYIYLVSSHQHNDLTIGGRNHVFRCQTCNRIQAGPDHIYNRHQSILAGEAVKDAWRYHYSFCDCGYQALKEHVYEYELRNRSVHLKRCKQCYQEELEAHFDKGRSYCFYCGQDLLAGTL